MTIEHIVRSLANYAGMLNDRADEFSKTAEKLKNTGDLARSEYYHGMSDQCGQICNTLGLMAGISSVEIGLTDDQTGDE